MFSLRDGRNNFADQAEQRHRRNDHVPTGLVVFDLELEEIALSQGFIDEAQFERLTESYGSSEYGTYLRRVKQDPRK